MGRSVGVKVLSWLEEPLPLIPPLDTTPTDAYIEKVRSDNLKALMGYAGSVEGKDLVAINFDDLIGIWVNLEGPQKEKIEQTLRMSPLFESYLKATSPKLVEKKAEVPFLSKEEMERIRKGKAKEENSRMENSGEAVTGGGKRIKINEKLVLHEPGSGGATQPTFPIRTMHDLEIYLFQSPEKEKPKDLNTLDLKCNPRDSPILIPLGRTAHANTTHPPSPITDHAIGLDRKLPTQQPLFAA